MLRISLLGQQAEARCRLDSLAPMSYLEGAVDDALFAEHLVPADENDANTIGIMKSALAATARKDRAVFCWGSGSGAWVDGSGVRAMCWAVGPGDVLGGWAVRPQTSLIPGPDN